MTAAAPKPLPVYSIKPSDGVFVVYRGDAPLETPRNLPVAVPTEKLAEAIVAECRAQGERLDLRKMPLTQMALTALDIAARQHDEIVAGIMRYGESELLCQRAAEPADLVAAQNAGWQPYLDWCRESFGADLRTGSGIVPFEQNPEALAGLRQYIETADAFRLTGISEAVGLCGSLVLGLALAAGHADAEAVLAAAELDRQWQMAKWGDDPAIAARHADVKRELQDCARWLALID